MAVKPASTWGTKWSAGVQNKAADWASGYIAAGDAVFRAGAASGPAWQAAVADPGALQRFQTNLGAVTMASVTPTVNGPGMAKYKASATNKNGNYNAFAIEFQPVLAQGVAALPARGPRRSPQNEQRMIQMYNFLVAKHGQFIQ